MTTSMCLFMQYRAITIMQMQGSGNLFLGMKIIFSFEKNDIGFVLANTSDTTGKCLCPDNDFLKQELDKFKGLKTVFVVLHIPPHFCIPESPFC